MADWVTAYRIFVGDADGHLKLLRIAPEARPLPPPPAARFSKKPEQQEPNDEDAHAAPAVAPSSSSLPHLQLLPIQGRANIPPPSMSASSSSVNASPAAIQQMAAGWLTTGHFILTLARRDGSIDVVLPLPQPDGSSDDAEQTGFDETEAPRAILVDTIVENRMRAGMERWISLHIGASGVYALTSAGILRFTPVVNAASSSAGSGKPSTGLSLGEATIFTLPRTPLSHALFVTLPHNTTTTSANPSADPTHLFSGGHEVPLSIWGLPALFASTGAEGPLAATADSSKKPSDQQAEVEAGDGEDQGPKRKRRKLKEKLQDGEVWRAKGLPHDALGLQQKPEIAAIALLSKGSPTEKTVSGLPQDLKFGIATKNGLFRLYSPTPESRSNNFVTEFPCLGGKAAEGKVRESKGVKGTMAIGLIKKGVSSGGNEVKLVQAGGQHDELFVADTQGKAYALSWEQRRILYQCAEIGGAVSSILSLPTRDPKRNLVLTTSLDRILRLHSSPSANPAHKTHGKANVHHQAGDGGKVVSQIFAGALQELNESEREDWEGTLPGAPTAAVWDGVVPALQKEAEAAGRALDGDTSRDGDDGGDTEEEEEDVWDEMDAIH